MKEINGVRVYGHMDYGETPSLALYRCRASMAGEADKGIPNGLPVDEWGIRVEDCHRGRLGSAAGANSGRRHADSIDWMKKYAAPEALAWLPPGRSVPDQGNCQQIFWYTAFTRAHQPGLPVVNADGTPKWRMAVAHGPYWKEGMQNGYQDRLLDHAEVDAAGAAQGSLAMPICVCKSTSLKKTLVV